MKTLWLTAAILTVAGMTAYAQNPTEEPAKELPPVTVVGDEERGESNVIVRESSGTAIFGAADQREVPFTINTVGTEEIKNRQSKTLIDALATDPSIGSVFGASDDHIFEAFTVRGFPMTNMIYNGLLIDAYFSTRPPESLEKIEVLRGPAGFRYGFIQPGGVINLVGKKPPEKRITTLEVSGADYGRLGMHTDIGDRTGSNREFGYRTNLFYSFGPTYADDTTKRRRGGAVALDYRLTKDVEVSASHELSEAASFGPGMSGYRTIGADANGQLPSLPDPSKQWLGRFDRASHLENYSTFGIKARLSDVISLHSTTAYFAREEYAFGLAAFSGWEAGGGAHELGFTGYLWRPRTVGNQTYLQFDFETGSVQHKVISGGSYTRINTIAKMLAADEFPSGIPSDIDDPVEVPAQSPSFGPNMKLENFQTGGYISDQMVIGAIRPMIGIRYSNLYVRPDMWNPRSIRNESVTPMAAVSYDLTSDSNIYVSYAEGLENGGRAPVDAANSLEQMDPIDSRQIEVGYKSDLQDGDVTLDGSIFQIEKTAAYVNGENWFVQEGVQVHKGIELLAKGRVTSSLEISSGVQLLDARYRADPARNGARPVDVPKTKAVLSADYRIPWLEGLFINSFANYVGKREITVPNNHKVAAYGKVDLGARYEAKVNMYPVVTRLNVENITDVRYWSTVGWAGGTKGAGEFGAPRSVRASIEFSL